MRKERCNDVLHDEQEYMERKYHTDNLDEYGEHAHYLTRVCHVQENTEDVDREQRKNHRLDGLHDDVLEIVERILQSLLIEVSQADTQGERHHECGHHVHRCRDGHGEERNGIVCLADLVDGGSRSNHARKEGSSRKVREETRDEGSGISHEGSHHEHASGLRTDVGNGRCHES